jgi:hypothetical protein
MPSLGKIGNYLSSPVFRKVGHLPTLPLSNYINARSLLHYVPGKICSVLSYHNKELVIADARTDNHRRIVF